MEKESKNNPENVKGDSENKVEQNTNKKFKIRKKQMYIKLNNLMNFYFSSSNLSKDRFLSQKLSEDPCKIILIIK